MIRKILFVFVITILIVGCASKRYAKKGFEFEQAGMYEKAAEMYFTSVTKNPKNVEAQIGLKKNGQLALDINLGKFLNLYNADNIKDAVYKFIECEAFHAKVLSAGTELNIPSHYKEYYAEVKEIYLQERYNEAYLLLEEEKFSDAENIFNEILKIQPGYQNVEELKNTAHFEPIYRQAKEYMDLEKYRKSYYKFQEILTKIPNYKDSKELNDITLDKATITIALLKFKNSSSVRSVHNELYGGVQRSLTDSESPFIKLIDRDNTDKLIEEQLRSLEGKTDDNLSAKAGKLLGAKAILEGQVVSYSIKSGELNKNLKKAYLKEKIVTKKGEEEIVTYKYHKVYYTDFTMNREVRCTFKYKLISTETGEILVSDVISKSYKDAIHYAEYDGNKNKLVPGHWVKKKVDSPKDVIKDDPKDIANVKALFKARKSIKPVNELKNSMHTEISKLVTKKIEKYDPES